MKKYTHETVAGFFVILGLLGVGYMTVKLGDVSLFGDDSYTLYAPFTSVSGLRLGNAVEIRGLQVGRVASFKLNQDSQEAVVELKIDNGVEVFDDAFASIKTAGLIGNKYVSIDAGGGGELLGSGDSILLTEPPIDIGDLVSKYVFGGVDKK